MTKPPNNQTKTLGPSQCWPKFCAVLGKAGVKTGDVLVSIDGQKAQSGRFAANAGGWSDRRYRVIKKPWQPFMTVNLGGYQRSLNVKILRVQVSHPPEGSAPLPVLLIALRQYQRPRPGLPHLAGRRNPAQDWWIAGQLTALNAPVQ